jgi:hypothetical protein
MLKRILQLFTILFIIACNNSANQNTTELIIDSYYFQKNIFNVNLYTCDRPKDDFKISYKSTNDQTSFINISEIREIDKEVSNCNLFFTQINELTPIKENLLKEVFYLEISLCRTNTDEERVYVALDSYLDYIKDNNIEIWSGISVFDENNFQWINIWPNQQYREDFLNDWVKSSESGKFASQLASVATCSRPETYFFTQ